MKKRKGHYSNFLSVLVVMVMVLGLIGNGFSAVPLLDEQVKTKPVVQEDAQGEPDTVVRSELPAGEPTIANEQSTVSSQANTTGTGLKEAGFSANQTADILSKSYNSSEVKISLIKAGYSENEVNSAMTKPAESKVTGILGAAVAATVDATTKPAESKVNGILGTVVATTVDATTKPAESKTEGVFKPGIVGTVVAATVDATTKPAESKVNGIVGSVVAAVVPVKENVDLGHNVTLTATKTPVNGILGSVVGAVVPVKENVDLEHNVTPTAEKVATTETQYVAAVNAVDAVSNKIANGEAVSNDEISAAFNQMAALLKSDDCNTLTDGQQNHLMNKFAFFANDQLFNSDNNKMGNENVLQTLVDTYQARMDGAGNNTTRANVIIRLHGSISKLGACNNTEAKTALLGALTDWTGKNDAKIESMVSEINNFVANPTAEGNSTVGLQAGAVLALVYHKKDTVGADDIMAVCASLMKSDSFKDVSHQGTVHWMAAGVINRNIITDSAGASKVADVVTGKAYAGSNASLQLVDAYFSSVKETMVAGGIEGAENAPAFNNFHAAFQSMSCVLNQISGRIGSTGSAERVSEHMFEGVSAETMQSYISEASARIDNSATPANAKVSYANGMVNLLTYGSMGNAKIDVSVGSVNFNAVMTSVKGLIADKGTMLKVRDLRTVNNFINAVTELSNLVMMDPSLTTSQKEAYAADFGDLLKGALSFHEGESSVNPSSYVAVNANAKVVVNGLTDNLNSRGYNNLADIMQNKLQGII